MREIMKNEEDNELVYDENQRQYIASEKKRISTWLAILLRDKDMTTRRIKEARETLEILSKQVEAS